jgi:hypothetical protein
MDLTPRKCGKSSKDRGQLAFVLVLRLSRKIDEHARGLSCGLTGSRSPVAMQGGLGYDAPMRHDRKSNLLLLLALLISLFAPEELEHIREVYLNGTSFQFYCFDSPLSNRDPDGVWRTSPRAAPGVAICTAVSEGILGALQYPATVVGAQRFPAPVFHLVLPRAPLTVAPLPAVGVVYSTVLRGPPLPRITPAPPPLRAPPV